MGDQGTSVVEFEPGTIVVQEKTAPTALYIVKEGQLEVYKTTKNGRLAVGIIGSGEYVGESAILLNKNHTSSVAALTKVTAVKISKESIDKQLEKTPKWFVSMAIGLINRLHQANEMLRKHSITDEKVVDRINALKEKHKPSSEESDGAA